MKQAPATAILSMLLALAAAQAPARAQDGAPAAGAETGQEGTAPAPQAQPQSSPGTVDPDRFGKLRDEAFGAFQRGHYLTALELARPRAEAGDAAAQTLIAEIHARGLGVPRDGREAAKWYGMAAEQGEPEAQVQYALMLLDGRFVKEDRDKAAALMRSAAEAGKPLAQFNLAQMMMQTSEEEAVAWYERAAAAGLPDAQYAMAQVRAHGVGGEPPDEEAARDWLLSAARNNFDTAQLDLGTWLVEGRGGERDAEEGFAWLKRAADGGNVAAMNRVAKLYRAGVGVEADHVLAAAWYIQARRAGLVDRDMEDFMGGLTDEQLKAAVERANRLVGGQAVGQ